MDVKRTVVIGDIFADLTTQIQCYPNNGEATYGTPLKRYGGGTAGNVAAGLGVLEMPTSIVCRLGDDENGQFLKHDMANYGVDTNGIVLDPNSSTGVVIITVDPEGERTIWVLAQNSAYEKLSLTDVEIIDQINPAAIFFTGFLIGIHPAEETIFAVARKWQGKAKLYFDPNLRYANDVVPTAVKTSMQELADLCDVVLTGKSEMEALELRALPNQTFVVKCGKDGSVLLNESGIEEYRIKATDHVAIDATGAGDNFAAAFIRCEMSGMSVYESLKFATVAAGISVTRLGARSMPKVEEIETYINHNFQN